jgi:hypothetical protein
MPPDMAWLDDYEYLLAHGRLPDGSPLPELLIRRIAWEITSEYAFRSRIGRTLEKTGSSVAGVDLARLAHATDAVLDTLRNEIGGLQPLRREQLMAFINGFLTLLKTKGAVVVPPLHGYVIHFGSYYMLSQGVNQLFMPHFGPHSRTPVFLTTRPDTRFDQLVSRSAQQTWYQDWASRCLSHLCPSIAGFALALYMPILTALGQAEILEEQQVKGERLWGLRPEALGIHTSVHQYRCDICGHNVSAQGAEVPLWEGNRCLRLRCKGHYQHEPAREDYYGRLYATGYIQRLLPAEHTALLERAQREQVEQRFITREHPWDPNLLSCTPTLEMGIDIGDLSSAVLCSVPPSQASYLQRIGRTGRRDGNAFTLTVANGRPHDLYFYAQPLEMLAGVLEPPGCFLSASAVLERQFTAFCFDNWVQTGIDAQALPRKLGIDHLEATMQEEPLPDTASLQKKYLVLYDRVPGGTGYLKELSQSAETMMDLFADALAVLQRCECREDPLKDGCYRCVYAYRTSFDMPHISRRIAIQCLAEILQHRERLVPTDTIAQISQSSFIESELEAYFIEALHRERYNGLPVQLRKDIVHHKTGWYCKVNDHGYYIEPQVELSARDGIPMATRPDFVIYPERQKLGRPVAVYLDGFAHHAHTREGTSRVGDDMARRMGLVRSGHFHVWSLTWKDVESRFSGENGYFAPLLQAMTPKQKQLIQSFDKDTMVGSLGDMNQLDSSAQEQAYWQEATLVAPSNLGLPQSFYEQEWEHVIQAHGISTEAEYLRASRLGRGQRLSRGQRQAVWPVFEEYRAILNRHHVKEFVDAIRDARILLETRTGTAEYQAVIVDEAQDISAEAFKLLRQIVPPVPERKNDLFIVGDAHQRIYAHRVVLSRCGIDVRGRSHQLRLNHRTTDEIRKWAVALLEDCTIDDLDGGKDDHKGYRSLLHGDFPEVKKLSSFAEEVEVIGERIRQLTADDFPLASICVVARTQALLEQYENALHAKGIDCVRIQHQVSDDPSQPGLRTATMHRVKGLEFEVVIIAGVNDSIVPLTAAAAEVDSDYAYMEFEIKERSLLYVATTRAKTHVLLTCHGAPSKFIA